jgi:hypothetical protein
MLQQEPQAESPNYELICEGVSPTGDPCDAKATYHCWICEKWFCAFHAEDEAWHRCALEPGDERGEG